MKKKISIAFDFDGTLASSLDLEDSCVAYGCASVGIQGITPEIVHSHYGPTEYGIIKQLVPPDRLSDAWNAFLSHYRAMSKDLKPLEGIEGLLKTLQTKKCLVFLITGRSKDTLDISLNDMGLSSYFIKTYAGSDTGTNKDESMKRIFRDYGITADDILYVGDTLDDIRMMKQVQVDILSAGYTHSLSDRILLEKENPGNVVSSISQLSERILTLID